eukprot:TRINITY_DN27124_c0_g1_i1.p1 TRINITY_DN27124_c0_g1~~TRINITY_DN27124_c0_g1_i1.p1  ORF type:complete len:102 (+),score=38.92 TRINITY_DN27124_c0_g1_i1:155-460(+)
MCIRDRLVGAGGRQKAFFVGGSMPSTYAPSPDVDVVDGATGVMAAGAALPSGRIFHSMSVLRGEDGEDVPVVAGGSDGEDIMDEVLPVSYTHLTLPTIYSV